MVFVALWYALSGGRNLYFLLAVLTANDFHPYTLRVVGNCCGNLPFQGQETQILV